MNALMKDDCAAVAKLLLVAGADATLNFNGQTSIGIAEKGQILAVLTTVSWANQRLPPRYVAC
jgi:hypothetical protein